jgi:hypothetical protein
MKRILVIAAVLVACSPPASTTVQPSIAATTSQAAASPSPSAESHVVLGTVAVAGVQSLAGYNGCNATPGYEDVIDGSNVVVKDENGTTIAAATLKILTFGGSPSPCRFAFSAVVPRVAFYHVTIGQRDGPTISYDDLAKANWKWEMSLGL